MGTIKYLGVIIDDWLRFKDLLYFHFFIQAIAFFLLSIALIINYTVHSSF